MTVTEDFPEADNVSAGAEQYPSLFAAAKVVGVVATAGRILAVVFFAVGLIMVAQGLLDNTRHYVHPSILGGLLCVGAAVQFLLAMLVGAVAETMRALGDTAAYSRLSYVELLRRK